MWKRLSDFCSNTGDKCKICEKDDRIFGTHSFTNSTSKRLGGHLIGLMIKEEVVMASCWEMESHNKLALRQYLAL